VATRRSEGLAARHFAALAASVAFALGPCRATSALAAGDGGDSRALALIRAYNARSFGDPGWRRVRLDLKSGPTVTRTFVVANLWRRLPGAVATLFVLEGPENLAGTNYLLVEDPDRVEGMEVHLHLPAGRRRVLAVAPGNFDEGLLGSDFGYRDLRLQIPVAGYGFRLAGRTELLGREVAVVEARPAPGSAVASLSWARSRFYLADGPPLLLGADHFAASADAEPVKRMRVEGVCAVEGAWTETRIVMTSTEGRSSVLSLLDFAPAVAQAAADLFSPEALPALSPSALAPPPAPGLRKEEARCPPRSS
jgi:hypothetical protein